MEPRLCWVGVSEWLGLRPIGHRCVLGRGLPWLCGSGPKAQPVGTDSSSPLVVNRLWYRKACGNQQFSHSSTLLAQLLHELVFAPQGGEGREPPFPCWQHWDPGSAPSAYLWLLLIDKESRWFCLVLHFYFAVNWKELQFLLQQVEEILLSFLYM